MILSLPVLIALFLEQVLNLNSFRQLGVLGRLSVEGATLDVSVVSLSPTLGLEII